MPAFVLFLHEFTLLPYNLVTNKTGFVTIRLETLVSSHNYSYNVMVLLRTNIHYVIE